MSPSSPLEPRRVAASLVRMARLIDPTDANAAPPLSRGRGGEEFRVPMAIVHGGVIMRMVDDAAGVCAARHVRGRVVTARVDGINFLAPVFVGDLVTATARVTNVWRTSLEVEVEVEAENLATGQVRHVAELAPELLTGVLYAARPIDPLLMAWGAGAAVLMPTLELRDGRPRGDGSRGRASDCAVDRRRRGDRRAPVRARRGRPVEQLS